MAKEPKERVEVTDNILQIPRGSPVNIPADVDPHDDPANSYTPPVVDLDTLRPQRKAPDPSPPTEPKPIQPRAPRTKSANQQPESSAPQRKKDVAPNKRLSSDYSRLNLMIHNDTFARLFTVALSRGMKYTSLIELYIAEGLDRHKD